MQKTLNAFIISFISIILFSLLILLFFIYMLNTYMANNIILIINMCCLIPCSMYIWDTIVESDKRFFCVLRSIIRPKEYKEEMDLFLKEMEHYRKRHQNNEEIISILSAYSHYKDAKNFVEINKRTGFKTCLIHQSQQKHDIHHDMNRDKRIIISTSYDFQRMCLLICQQYKYDYLWTNSYYVRS